MATKPTPESLRQQGTAPRGPGEPAPPAERQPPSPAPGVTPPTEGTTCCCDDITLYLKSVKVVNRTDAPIPLVGGILGSFVDDRVFVRARGCDGARFTWPRDVANQKCEEGNEVAIDAPLAVVKPSGDCQVNCSVEIQAFRASRVSEILDALNALLPELTAAAAAYAEAVSGASTLRALAAAAQAAMSAAPVVNPAAQAQSATATSQARAAEQAAEAAKDRVEELEGKVAALERALLGASDALMGDFYINFRGPLGCDDPLKRSIPAPSDATAVNLDEVTFLHTMRNNGGVWELRLRALRTCSARRKP